MVFLIGMEFHIVRYITAKHPRILLFLFFHYEGLTLFVIQEQSAESVRQTYRQGEGFVFDSFDYMSRALFAHARRCLKSFPLQ